MFTGIIEETGTVKKIIGHQTSGFIEIKAKKVLEGTNIGDSIAVNGVCLTVTKLQGDSFVADVMAETLRKTNLGSLPIGASVNLERAMAANGRFGGHIVSGHIDGTGTITKVEKDDNAIWYTIAAEENLMKYIVEKGSIAIDGISLTVAKRSDMDFAISMIPHTAKETVLSQKKPGDIVNLENDIVGKYIEQLMHYEKKEEKKESRLTKEFLLRAGF